MILSKSFIVLIDGWRFFILSFLAMLMGLGEAGLLEGGKRLLAQQPTSRGDVEADCLAACYSTSITSAKLPSPRGLHLVVSNGSSLIAAKQSS
jgi:hypothetical protein